jgi:hypothetical protein
VANAPVRVSREETRDFATVRAVYSGSGEFPVHVVQEDGLPNVALTVFANDLRRMLSDGSVRGYIRETLAFVNWCASDPVAQTRHWHWQAEPPQVRHAVRQYLTVAAECRITVRPDTLGLKASLRRLDAATNRHSAERRTRPPAMRYRRIQKSLQQKRRLPIF